MFLLDASVVRAKVNKQQYLPSIIHIWRENSMMMFSMQCKHIFYTCHISLVSLLLSIIAHFKVKDYGMGMYSFSSNIYTGCCLRIHTTLAQALTFNTRGSFHVQQKKTQQGKVRLVTVVPSDITRIFFILFLGIGTL